MANFMDTLLLRIDVQSRNAEAALKRVSIMVEGLAASTRGLGTMFMQLNQSQLAGITKTNAMMVKQSGYTDLLAQSNQNAVKSLFGVEKQMKRMNMQVFSTGFGLLFMGMALQRLGQSIINSLVKTYMSATDEQSRFNQQLMSVQAAFEFLKFSIMDALGQSELVSALIEGFINLINNVSLFIAKHPFIAKLIVLFAVLAIVVGAVAMIMGQVGLALMGSALIIMGGLFLIGTAVIALFAIWNTEWGTGTKILATVGALLIGLIGIMITFGKTQKVIQAIGTAFIWLAKNPLKAGLIGAIILVVAAIMNMADAFGGFGNFFNVVMGGVGKVLVLFSSWLQNLVIDKIITMLETAQRIANFLGQSGLASQLSSQIVKLQNLRALANIGTGILLERIDVATGADAIRAANPDVENFGALVTGQTTFDQEIFDDISAETTAHTAKMDEQIMALDELGGGSSLADIQQAIDDGNAQQAEAEAKAGQTNNFDIAINGIAGDNDSLAEFIKQTINDTLDEANNRNNGAPQGG